MRVLVVTTMYPIDEFDGNGVFVKDLFDSMKGEYPDLQVDYIKYFQTRHDQARAKYAFGKAYLHLRVALQLLIHRLSRNRTTDVIQVFGANFLIFAALLFDKQKIVFTAVTPTEVEKHKYSTFIKKIAQRFLPSIPSLVVMSNAMARALSYRDVKVIPFGINYQLFRPTDKSEARRKLGLSENKFILLFSSNPKRKEKRYDRFKEVLDKVHSMIPDAEELLMMNALQPTSGYRYVSGGLHRKDIPLYLNAADVLIVTSDIEGSPTVVKEAIATNTPIISYDVGDVRDLITNIKNCFICKDTDEMVRAVKQIKDSGAGANGRDVLRDRISLQPICALYMDIYRGLQQNMIHGTHRQ